ncbi:hypothetical protein FQR65_LT15158 [Abscondita terminalis]|nr:hypothetical protein FQR65_LT15142 [Abscondita terminalis]KAF5279923.1 hypothetical protein FQR65_LT15158 [Abscondita terminalis]
MYQRIQERLGLKKSTEFVQSASKQNYFTQARSWADDIYTAAIISRNRYQMAFFSAMGLATLAILAIIMLIPLQHIEPLLVNHYPSGHILVQPMHQPYAPSNSEQIESELVQYVINRESYADSSYDEQYSLINILSNNEVAKEYREIQSVQNPESPINRLGQTGLRSDKDKLSNQQTRNRLATVNFTVTEQINGIKTIKPYAVIMAWEYRTPSDDPGERWRNWDGFTVTRYSVEQRNV